MVDITERKAATQNFANEIWTVADILHGPFNDDEYGEVILPFSLLRRFECVLEPKKTAVQAAAKTLNEIGVRGEDQYAQLCVVAGLPFYNLSNYRLSNLGQTHTKENLIVYKNSFSKNVRDIFDHFEFDRICERLTKSKKIYAVVEFFKKLDMNVSARSMSNLYEELIWRFADSKHKASKEYLTPRDVVHLASCLVLNSDKDVLTSATGLLRTCYDPTCGTCGFITDAMDYIREQAPNDDLRTRIIPSGQEINDVSWAMGKAMMLLYGCEDDQKTTSMSDLSTGIRYGNTLTNDLHAGTTFDYVFSNPPFGMDWKDVQLEVKADPRFSVGLPKVSDGSMLFLTHVVQKIAPTGQGAIILSGSPLFSGDSGSNAIRRWILESDVVEAIVQLPGSLFYNTSIQTYLWLLNKAKPVEKKGKIALVNASELKTLIRNIGSKRYIISNADIDRIAREVADFKDSEITKVCDYREFGTRTVTVQRPFRAKLVITEESIKAVSELKPIQKLDKEAVTAICDVLRESMGEHPLGWKVTLESALKAANVKVSKAALTAIVKALLVRNPTGEVVKDKDGNVEYDSELKQSENVPLLDSVDEYFKTEVLPFVPDALIDKTVVDDTDGQIGPVSYEINFNKYFYKYEPPREPAVIAAEIVALEEETSKMMKGLFA
ncbi:type I restriction-modification system subunit M [Sutterella wadsworthensis]|uniref:type I restriction-modification system subunit M n=1 Tax=Sutterella wadsworthensis TaxID=40545 RepID=UPI00402A9EC6